MKKGLFFFSVPILFLFLVSLLHAQDFSRANLSNSDESSTVDGSVVLQYDNGTNFDAIGLTAGGTFGVSARFPASMTGPYAGYNLTQMEIYINDGVTSVNVRIYDQGTSTTPGTLLLNESATVTALSWNTITLSTPVAITGNDIWVGYEVTHGAGTFPCGVDAGPAQVDGDWIELSGAWSRLSVIAPSLNYNWNIHAILEPGGGPGTGFAIDFESFTTGQQVACQDPVNWTTWSNLPCDAVEDAYISSNYAYSGSNSMVIVQNNDEVKPFGTQTTGKWDMIFMCYIPTGATGYFNQLALFAGATSSWGLEVYFNAGGAGSVNAGATGAGSFNWIADQWIPVEVVVDLDASGSPAEFWYNGNMVISWNWTLGSNGAGCPLQVDANDFFGAVATDQMYVDDYQFGPWPIVPVELTSFTGNVNNNGQVVLNWSTATELNNQMFEIQRKEANNEYHTLGFVNGHGTTTEVHDYSYVDQTVATGMYSYRLKQIDFNGRFEYSPEIEVDVKGPLTFALQQNYPNPFNPSTKIEYSVPQTGNVKLAVYNVVGEEVAVLVNGVVESGFHSATFDASNLPSGMYIYKLQSNNTVEVKKMMLLK